MVNVLKVLVNEDLFQNVYEERYKPVERERSKYSYRK
jgi:hypothetical protein